MALQIDDDGNVWDDGVYAPDDGVITTPNDGTNDDFLRAIGINPATTMEGWNSPTNKQILKDIGYTGTLDAKSIADFAKKLFTNKDGTLNLPAIGGIAGGLLGAAGLGQAKITPTGYQGGIPTLTASQPMLTAPPVGRRPGSGGINYGTGVQYKDAQGNIVSDTSTSVANLLAAANANPYNQTANYGQGTTGGGITNLPTSGNTSGGNNAALIQALQKALAANRASAGSTLPNAGIANAPAAPNASATSPKFTVGGGGGEGGYQGYPSKEAYDRAVAYNKAQQDAAQAKLDAFHIDPSSPFYKYVQDPKSIPHYYNESDADALLRVKKNAMEYAEQLAGRAAQASTFPGSQFIVANGGIKDANGNTIAPGPDEIGSVITDANGVPRYMKKSEAAAQDKAKQDYLKAHGNIIDTEHPWNVASTDTGTQSVQAALAKLSQTPGDDKTRQAALSNFLKTTTFTPKQLAEASNGLWSIEDLKTQMAGNPVLSQPDVDRPTDPTKGSASTLEDMAKARAKISSLGMNVNDAGNGLAGIAPTQSNFVPTAPTAAGLDALVGQASTPMTGVSPAGILKTETASQYVAPTQEIDRGGPDIPPTPAAPNPEPLVSNLQSLAGYEPAYDWGMYNNMGSKAGGLIGHHMAQGGIAGLARGRYLQGSTDGMADKLPTTIDGHEPAALSHGEFVVPADVVSHLGNGNSDAGAKKLYQMMDKIRMARTGTKKQGKEINPDKFMPGGLARAYAEGGRVKGYAGTDPTGSLVQAGVTGTEQNLSNWAGPAMTQMLGQAQALANTPYQAYTGPLTAGASDLQTQAFNAAANLAPTGGMATDFAQQAGNLNYTPTTSSFNAGFAQQYMNPYLQASLDPQLAEARRQSDITNQVNNAAMTKAGAFGGGRQAIMSSENQRNLGTNLANITGTGYNTAYDKAMAQFNADQNRQMQENQFANTSKIAGLNAGISGLNTANQMGINNLNTQAALGATQRGIESEGIAADKAQFEEARKDPYTKLQYLQSMFNGLPITAQNYNMSTPSTLQQAISGAGGLAGLFGNKTNLTLTDVQTALKNLGINV